MGITMTVNLLDRFNFSKLLYEEMKSINPGISVLENMEFCDALENIIPEQGWDSILLDGMSEIECLVNSLEYYQSIQLKPHSGSKIVLDDSIIHLTRMLFVGLVTGAYPVDWINQHFYFDIRGFYFLHRTTYFTQAVMEHLGGEPYCRFEPRQNQFKCAEAIGYKEFKEANVYLDQFFMDCVQKLATLQGKSVLLGIAGPTAAGKTEIVARLLQRFKGAQKSVTTIEMDNFLKDRDYREAHGIDSLGREALHLELFLSCLKDILAGEKITTPRYDFIAATSSHDLEGKLKSGGIPLMVEPADIILIEGNFPFLLPEVADLVSIKVVYLTDDEIRLKRKWRRDMDYRKKYDQAYHMNRYFREQYLMAETVYIPQMEICDLVVDTTGGCIWVSQKTKQKLENRK